MIVDTNVHLSRWPFRRLPGDETAELVARLRSRGVARAWAGSFDGILHRDIGGVNARLAEDCRTHGGGLLVPFGSINPKLPGWQEDVRRCVADYRMPGIRLHPNYHGYRLDDPVFVELLQAAAAHRLIVQLAVSMEDTRTQHPLVRVPPVDVSPLRRLLDRVPQVRLMLLNWAPALTGQPIEPLAGTVYFDISTVEGIAGIARLVERIPAQRVLFGSNAPLFYFEAALLKMRESGLPDEKQSMILERNAGRLLREAAP